MALARSPTSGEFGALLAHVDLKRLDQRLAEFLANSSASLRRFAVDGSLDVEQGVDASHKPRSQWEKVLSLSCRPHAVERSPRDRPWQRTGAEHEPSTLPQRSDLDFGQAGRVGDTRQMRRPGTVLRSRPNGAVDARLCGRGSNRTSLPAARSHRMACHPGHKPNIGRYRFLPLGQDRHRGVITVQPLGRHNTWASTSRSSGSSATQLAPTASAIVDRLIGTPSRA